MTEIMWPFGKKRSTAGIQRPLPSELIAERESSAALAAAQENYDRVFNREEEVEDRYRTLRGLRRANHFTDMIEESMRRKG